MYSFMFWAPEVGLLQLLEQFFKDHVWWLNGLDKSASVIYANEEVNGHEKDCSNSRLRVG